MGGMRDRVQAALDNIELMWFVPLFQLDHEDAKAKFIVLDPRLFFRTMLDAVVVSTGSNKMFKALHITTTVFCLRFDQMARLDPHPHTDIRLRICYVEGKEDEDLMQINVMDWMDANWCDWRRSC